MVFANRKYRFYWQSFYHMRSFLCLHKLGNVSECTTLSGHFETSHEPFCRMLRRVQKAFLQV
jgi:hypothetical protein